MGRLSCPSVSLTLKETNPESSQGTEGAQDLGGGEWAVTKIEQLFLGKESQRTRPKKGVPSASGPCCPSPGLLWGSPLSLQADSSLLFPMPACSPGPGELRHPSLRLKLHSGPGAKPVSMAWSHRAGSGQWGLAGWGGLGDLDS